MGDEASAGGRPVSLLPGEQVRDQLVANHVGDNRVFEGFLYVTTQRLIFGPWPAAEKRGAGLFVIPFTEVSGVDVAPRGTSWRDGSRRHRLRVTKVSGDDELFVVTRPQKAVDLIERARHGAL